MKMPKQPMLGLAIIATIACGAEALAQDTPPDPAQQAIQAEQAQQAADAVQQDVPAPPQAPMPPPPTEPAAPPLPPTEPPVPPPPMDATPPVAPEPPLPTDVPPPSDVPAPDAPMAPPSPAAGATTPQAVDEAAPASAGTSADVKSVPPDSVVGEYKIDFAAMDANGDGYLNRAEARSNQTLTDEFRAVDNDHNGRLSKEELAGWM